MRAASVPTWTPPCGPIHSGRSSDGKVTPFVLGVPVVRDRCAWCASALSVRPSEGCRSGQEEAQNVVGYAMDGAPLLNCGVFWGAISVEGRHL